MDNTRPSVQTVLGGIVVLVGLALLADSTGILDVGSLLVFVPSLFVLLGLYALVTGGIRNLVGPLFIILVALAWQLVALDVLEARDVVQFWPLLVVLFGLSLVLGQYRAQARTENSDHILLLAFFGGAERRISSPSFRSADLTALFGGIELDLRDATIADPPATISTTTIFGGTEIRAPRDWNVRIDVVPVLGASEDSRGRPNAEHEDLDLVITGFVAFGAMELLD